ncbi:alkaline phosphatase [Dongia sp.]|uniref:alkaline phosphatase D family protein n=1 Tax=Dongia sp. TaxID=1977262 RepID=UPI0035B06FA7
MLLGGATLAGFTVSSSGLANFAPHYLQRISRSPFPLTQNPFCLGVAAGAPGPDGFVLWTRLALDPLATDPVSPGGIPLKDHGHGIAVDYEIALEPEMRRVVAAGVTLADPRYGFSIHLNVAGLQPAREYWYRFHLGDAESPVGRAITLPAAGRPATGLRLGMACCANYERGYFAAYRHLADEQPDMTLFLGDYIYEQVEQYRSVIRRHSDEAVPIDLDGYRRRYAQYRLDPDLQRLHATTMTLATWDDHEVENDYAGDWSESFTPHAEFVARRRAAYQAFYEHMPLRWQPSGDHLRIHDCVTYGDLARISLLDGRQYRDRGACYGMPDRGGGHLVESDTCAELLDPSRSMLGADQERWLAGNLTHSPARWNILAQNVIMAPLGSRDLNGRVTAWTDAWDGYPMARDRLLSTMHDQTVRNPVVFSGDIHSFWHNDLRRSDSSKSDETIATEFVVSSVTSDGPPQDQLQDQVARHPHIHFAESRHRGYALVEIAGDRMLTHFRTIGDVTDDATHRNTLASFAIEDGRNGAVAV